MCSQKDLNVLAYLCFFYMIRLEPSSVLRSHTSSDLLSRFLLSPQSRHAKMCSDSQLFCAVTHLDFFFLFCGIDIQTVLIVLFLLKHDVSCMYRGVSECVCGVIRTVFLESFHVWRGWCQSYVFTNNVLMVTHINSLVTNNVTSSRWVFYFSYKSLPQLIV